VTTKLTFAAALAIAALGVLAMTALGHAKLVSSDPADGATIKTPHTLTATFDEELTPNGSSIVVESSAGSPVVSGTVSTADDKVMTAELPQLQDGQYTVLWTAVTADDNAVERGMYHFSVGTVGSPVPTPAPASTQGTGSGNDLLLPLALVVVAVAAVAGFFLYRNRRR
jgi:methionine-rich copper-binding protein CopC